MVVTAREVFVRSAVFPSSLCRLTQHPRRHRERYIDVSDI